MVGGGEADVGVEAGGAYPGDSEVLAGPEDGPAFGAQDGAGQPGVGTGLSGIPEQTGGEERFRAHSRRPGPTALTVVRRRLAGRGAGRVQQASWRRGELPGVSMHAHVDA